MDDTLLMSLVREYGNLRAVASLLKVDHPVLRAVVRKKPEINVLAQSLMQSGYKKPRGVGLKNLLRQDLCSYCGIHPSSTPQGRMTIDHVEPRGGGGANTLENMAAACSSCNSKKADKDLLTFLLEC